jgi:NAD(P)-dependent dehydrogenase (short-subunit alcohol dehydrogenase family)
MSKLDGKVVVITGGSSGIGLASAKLFVAEGAHVFIMGRRQSQLDEAVRQIGRNVTAVQGDVAKIEDIDRLYRVVGSEKGRLDVVFANAAVQITVPIGNILPDQYAHVFDTNVKGTVFTVQKALPLLVNGGSVLLTASIAASKGNPSRSIYAASKAAVRSFARSWANDLKSRNIRVNAISPGPTDTPALSGPGTSEQALAEIKAKLSSNVPLGRLAGAEEIARAALFLVSDDSSFVTGTEMFVDGGFAQI